MIVVASRRHKKYNQTKTIRAYHWGIVLIEAYIQKVTKIGREIGKVKTYRERTIF